MPLTSIIFFVALLPKIHILPSIMNGRLHGAQGKKLVFEFQEAKTMLRHM